MENMTLSEMIKEDRKRDERLKLEAMQLLLKEYPELEKDFDMKNLNASILESTYYANLFTIYHINTLYRFVSKRNTDIYNHIQFISEISFYEVPHIIPFYSGYIVADYHKSYISDGEVRLYYFNSRGNNANPRKGRRHYVKAHIDKNGTYFKQGNNKIYLD